MSIYIALGLGGMGINNKVTLDKDIDITYKADAAKVKKGQFKISKDADGEFGMLFALPVSLGYKHVDGKWQYKAEVAGNALAFKAFDKGNTTVRDLGHVKVAAGYRVSDRIVASGFAGFGLAHVTNWNVKDQNSNRFDLVKEDGKAPCGLSKEIFLGLEGQYQVCSKSYITVATQAGLPFMNDVSSEKNSFKAAKSTLKITEGLVLENKTGAETSNVNASLWSARVTVGFMYELGGF